MSKFIELPIASFNSATQTYDRKPLLVNLDRIIKVTPESEFVCRVTLAGGSSFTTSRRYDTLSNQIMHREGLDMVFPTEELDAAYQAGCDKTRNELTDTGSYKKQVKAICNFAAQWFDRNPVSMGWQSKFKKDLRAALESDFEGYIDINSEDE